MKIKVLSIIVGVLETSPQTLEWIRNTKNWDCSANDDVVWKNTGEGTGYLWKLAATQSSDRCLVLTANVWSIHFYLHHAYLI